MISSSLLSALLWLWRDHKIYPSLSSWKKNVPLLSLVKRMEFERERERGRVVGWFWHIFSVVIMDPSYRMICSSTWLTELSSINKHSTCRNTHSKFPLFSELRLDCGAWLTCSSALCPRKNKKELLAAILLISLPSSSRPSVAPLEWHLVLLAHSQILTSSGTSNKKDTKKTSAVHAEFSRAQQKCIALISPACGKMSDPQAGRGISHSLGR